MSAYEGYLYGHICSVTIKMLETILIGETGPNLILLLHLLYAYPHEMLYVCVCAHAVRCFVSIKFYTFT